MTTYIILFNGEKIGTQELTADQKRNYENTENIALIKKEG